MSLQFRRYRFATAYPVTLTAERGIRKLKVLDINEDGALLEEFDRLRDGDAVTVIAMNHHIRGHVQWMRERKMGISFVPPITTQLVAELRQGLLPHGGRVYSSIGLREMR